MFWNIKLVMIWFEKERGSFIIFILKCVFLIYLPLKFNVFQQLYVSAVSFMLHVGYQVYTNQISL